MADLEILRKKIRASGASPSADLIGSYSDAFVTALIGVDARVGSLPFKASLDDMLECLQWMEPNLKRPGNFITNTFNLIMYLTQHSSDNLFKVNMTVRLLALLPKDFPACHVQRLEYNAGVFYDSMNETYLALYHLHHSVALAASYKSSDPLQYARDMAASLSKIGHITMDYLQNINEATRILKLAYSYDPSNAILCNTLIILLNKIGEHEDALRMSHCAVKLVQKSRDRTGQNLLSVVYLNMASTYSNLNLLNDAMMTLEKSIAMKIVDNPMAYTQWLFLRQHSLSHAGTPQLLQDYKKFNGVYASILTTHYKNDDTSYIPFAKRTNSVLRIGLVSSDFVDHSVGDFIRIVLTAVAQRSDVCIFAYFNKARNIADRFPSVQWRNIHNMPAPDAVRLIKKDHIDILIDLNAHTEGHRLDIFACKAAPKQITYCGYAATTGLASMDACLSDAMCHPSPGLCATQYSEELVFMPRSFLCYTPRHTLPELELPPCASLPYYTFGSYHRINKLNDRVIYVYNKILQAVPTAKLIFKSIDFIKQSLVAQTRKQFDEDTQDRLVFLPTTRSHEEHVLTFKHMDLALDAWPYSGTTTTCEALSMGIPILTLRDEITWITSQNITSMILMRSGLHEFVARSEDEYIQRAIHMANQGSMALDRKHIRNAFCNGPLCDTEQFPHDFVATLNQFMGA